MVSSVDAVCLPLRMHAANTPYYFPNRSRRCRKQTILGFIHRTTWNRNSRKFISKIVHSLTPIPLKTPAPGTLHSPAPMPLVTPMNRYARSWMFFSQTNVCTSERTPHAPALMLQVARRGYAELLRRVMCNELDQQVRQVAQRSAEGVVDPLSAGVCRHLGGQARQQPSQRLGPMALQSEEVLELADDPFYDLTLARGPAPIGLRPRPARIVLGGGRHQRPVLLHPMPLPL